MTPTLDYSTARRRRLPFRPRLGHVAILVVVSSAVLCWIWGLPLTSADIRLDTGDLRYRYLGIPMAYERVPEPQRTRLLALAAGSQVLVPEWRRCATFPLPSSNNTHRMCRGWYARASVWAAQDPPLARLMLEDVAAYVDHTSAVQGLPPSATLLSGRFVLPDVSGNLSLKPGWQQDEAAVAYMQWKGHAPPATQAAPTTR